MKSERFILSFIALLIGLLVAGGAFYLYQSMKALPSPKDVLTVKPVKSSPTPDTSGDFITVETPADEAVVDRKIITIAGKTLPDTTIIVSSDTEDQVIKPASNGNYTLTQTIGDGVNILQITAIFPDGSEKKISRTITYSTESF